MYKYTHISNFVDMHNRLLNVPHVPHYFFGGNISDITVTVTANNLLFMVHVGKDRDAHYPSEDG